MIKIVRLLAAAFLTGLPIWIFAHPGWSGNTAKETHPASQTALPSHPKTSLLVNEAQPAARDNARFGAADFTLDDPTTSMAHVVKPSESIASLAWRYLPQTVYQRRSDLEDAIRRVNALKGNMVRPGESIVIPGIPARPILDKPVTVPRDFDARAIYLTGWTAGSERGLELIKRWQSVGGNAVVFDVKDFDGEVRVPFNHKYAPHEGVTIRNLPKFIHWLHSLHMHVIARIACFRDEHMAQTYPGLDIRSRRTGKPWLETGKLDWVDPSLPEAQDYNLDLAKMAAEDGADEIQLDYVRFPAQGDQADAVFSFQKDHPDWKRSKIITAFVARAYNELHPMGVLVSLDVFGVMAWARPADLSLTGQSIPELAHHCDVISPMIYPSHFFHFDGYADPGDAPEHFISESMDRFEEAVKGSGVVIRPWLQAFAWRTKSYSAGYVRTEIRTAAEAGGIGFLFWNADNNYPKPIQVMDEMRAAGDWKG
ncbi:MAG: putative glycoside hydrolase [Terriglobia bacterium]